MTLALKDFRLPSYEGHTPLSWYEETCLQTGFVHDDAQKQAILVLEQLWQDLIVFKNQRQKLFGKSFRKPTVPKGLFLWGGVGRGKSFLMDAFFATLPFQRKRRVHFHAFMSEVHARLNMLKHKTNPLDIIAKDLAQEVRVLCFDEFHVSDIADAMILGGLLKGLLERGVVLVATSNYSPSGLYPNGLKRDVFSPAIKLLEEHLKVVKIEGDKDYRKQKLSPADVFFMLDEEPAFQKISEIFQFVTNGQMPCAGMVTILGREIAILGEYERVIWFDFENLCCTYRSQEDYLVLAKKYQTFFLSGLCALSAERCDDARRLTWLIDIFYDYRVKMVVSSSVPVNEIYGQGDFSHEFVRTTSRMLEMQSLQYSNLPHLTLGEMD